MGSLKNFRIWLGWWFDEHVIFGLLFLFLGAITFLWPFIRSFYEVVVLDHTDLSPFFFPSGLIIIRSSCGLIALAVFFWADAGCTVTKNYRKVLQAAEEILADEELHLGMVQELRFLAKKNTSMSRSVLGRKLD